MKYRLQGRDPFSVFSEGIAGIHVAVESRKITAGDMNSNAMSFLKEIAGRGHINSILIDFTRDYELGIKNRSSVFCPHTAL